jgi:hypothetical protein
MPDTPPTRSTEYNHGMLVDRDAPDDRYIVGGAFVLMDDAGEFSVYFSKKPAAFGFRTSAMPNDEVLLELAAMIRAAWDLASLNTDPAPND